MTKAIYIIGPESSGNRLMLRLMFAAGCQGELRDNNSQLYDASLPPDNGKPIAYLRTMPHAQKMYDPKEDILKLRKLGYDVMAIVMVRDWLPTVRSQIQIKHCVFEEDAERRIREALALTFYSLQVCNVPFVLVTYEGLIKRTYPMVQWLCEWLELPDPTIDEIEQKEIYDGDAKYWQNFSEWHATLTWA